MIAGAMMQIGLQGSIRILDKISLLWTPPADWLLTPRLIATFLRPRVSGVRLEAVGKRHEIGMFARRRSALLIAHRLAKSLVELLELRQNPRAKFDVVVADQSDASAKILVDGTQGYQFSLLNIRAIAKIITISDEALDGGRSRQSDFL